MRVAHHQSSPTPLKILLPQCARPHTPEILILDRWQSSEGKLEQDSVMQMGQGGVLCWSPREVTVPHDDHMRCLHPSIICGGRTPNIKCESAQWVGVQNSSTPSLSSLPKPCFPFIQRLASVSLCYRSLASRSSSISVSFLCLALSLSCTSLASLRSAILPWLHGHVLGSMNYSTVKYYFLSLFDLNIQNMNLHTVQFNSERPFSTLNGSSPQQWQWHCYM